MNKKIYNYVIMYTYIYDACLQCISVSFYTCVNIGMRRQWELFQTNAIDLAIGQRIQMFIRFCTLTAEDPVAYILVLHLMDFSGAGSPHSVI